MYTLVIGFSRSKNFNKAIDIAASLGGTYENDSITVNVMDDMKAYEILFPLFRLNVLSWANTRAYHDGKRVNPFKFAFFMECQRKRFYSDVLEQLDPKASFKELLTTESYKIPCLYYKREGNRFSFQSNNKKFHLELTGKRLFDFVDKFDIGDIVYFE